MLGLAEFCCHALISRSVSKFWLFWRQSEGKEK